MFDYFMKIVFFAKAYQWLRNKMPAYRHIDSLERQLKTKGEDYQKKLDSIADLCEKVVVLQSKLAEEERKAASLEKDRDKLKTENENLVRGMRNAHVLVHLAGAKNSEADKVILETCYKNSPRERTAFKQAESGNGL